MNAYDALVSVIVPNYNYGEWIEELLDSILNQSYSSINWSLLMTGLLMTPRLYCETSLLVTLALPSSSGEECWGFRRSDQRLDAC